MGQFNTPGTPVMTAYQRTVGNCKRLIAAEQYDSAVALLEELRQQQPRDVNVLRMLGHALMMIDSRELSIRHLLFASKLEPANVEIHIDLASAHRRLDQMHAAASQNENGEQSEDRQERSCLLMKDEVQKK